MATFIKKIFSKREDCLLIVVCVIFGIIMSQVRIANDDSVHINSIGNNIFDCWKWSMEIYHTWSSRILINFLWAFVLQNGKIGMFIYASVSMYVVLKAVIILFGKSNCYKVLLFAVSIMMLFPWEVYITAGWVATFTSYFGPQAFAIMALVPIKKVLCNEKMCWWEIIIYALCLLYGTNAEQMCVVVLGIYIVSLIYFWIKKSNNWVIWLQFLLTIASMVFTVTCPGNSSRDVVDQAYWFPTYGMMDSIDKADIGVSTTLKWMFVDGNPLIILMCLLMTTIIWKKYKDVLYRVIALIPTVFVLLMGPLEKIFVSMFPNLQVITKDVDYYGSFNVATQGVGRGPLQFFIFLAIAICIVAEIILINEKIEGCLIDLSLILMGVASRCMMGFSATVYASSTRTYTSLIFCFMVVAVHMFSKNINVLIYNNTDGEKGKVDISESVMWILTVLGFINLTVLVGTAFY